MSQQGNFDVILVDCKNSLKNYCFVIINQITQDCIIIDTVDTPIIADFVRQNHLNLIAILHTHHHVDHIGGNKKLKEAFGCTIYAHEADKHRIHDVDYWIKPDDIIAFFDNQINFKILPLDGHTIGHIAFYEAKQKWLFSGDTVFNLGCGRLFEGTAEQYYKAFKTIKALPDNTIIYGTHEYTLDNIAFAKSIIDQDFTDYDLFIEYCQLQESKRTNQQPTIPFTLASQKKFNPFFLTDNNWIQNRLGHTNDNGINTLATMRQLKDEF